MASTVIIGAGITGASAAYHLAVRGLRDVILVDRADRPGQGATGLAIGGFRAGLDTPTDIRLSLLSRDRLLAFRHDTGTDPRYNTIGTGWMAGTEGELGRLRERLDLHHAEGLIETLELDDERIGWLFPAVDRSRIAGAILCPTDGHVAPRALLQGYLEAAARLGVRVEWNTEVTGLDRAADGTLRAVHTAAGPRPAVRVVNAAGVRAPLAGRDCGLDVPVAAAMTRVVATAQTRALPMGMPDVIFVGDGLHVRAADGHVLLLQATSRGLSRRDAVGDAWIDEVAEMARARVPALANVPIDRERSWIGEHPATADGRALLGPHPDCPNYFLAIAAEGRGIMHAPALGVLLAEMVVDGAASAFDARPLLPGRFLETGARRSAAS